MKKLCLCLDGDLPSKKQMIGSLNLVSDHFLETPKQLFRIIFWKPQNNCKIQIGQQGNPDLDEGRENPSIF